MVEQRGVEPRIVAPGAERIRYTDRDMAEISKKKILYLGKLARIGLSDRDAKKLTANLDEILGYVNKLQKVKTVGLTQTNQVTGLTDVWRKDEPAKQKLGRDALLANAPMTKDGYIKVPKVL